MTGEALPGVRVSDDRDAALATLRAGGVVAAATESFFGLLADATNWAAVDRVLELKPRGADKGIPLLLPDEAGWARLVSAVPREAALLAKRFWPGPLSIALPRALGVDTRLCLSGRVAVRLAATCPAGDLARRFGRPLTATSANPPGEPPPTETSKVVEHFSDAPSLFVLAGNSPGGSPSTIVVFDGSVWSVARVGAVSEADVWAALRAVTGQAPADGSPA